MRKCISADAERVEVMNNTNPKFILRNYLAQVCGLPVDANVRAVSSANATHFLPAERHPKGRG
jgi:hypothetical protein